MARLPAAFVLAIVLAAAFSPSAFAHAVLIATQPGNDEVVPKSPDQVILEFGLHKPAYRICVNTPSTLGAIGRERRPAASRLVHHESGTASAIPLTTGRSHGNRSGVKRNAAGVVS